MLLSLVVAMPLEADELYDAIGQRLGLMREVAAYKWINQQPIEAPDREALVIKKAKLSGLNHAITTDSSERFFSAQIEAAKEIQQCWFDRWQKSFGPAESRDLINDVRPRLLELGQTINELLAHQVQDKTSFMSQTQVDCLSSEGQQKVFEAIKQIQVYPSRLTQIRDSGIIRIGTTGDYAPFSFSSNGADFKGIDIELALLLSEHLDTEVLFVETSWPTLITDLKLGLFDIGMSGISRIPSREEVAYFSHAYHIGGKTPIARCDNQLPLDSLQSIDQPGTRVIVNPGGTNERFLDAHVQQATKILHPDNRTIFDEIVVGNADVMFTDLIEAQLQSQRAELCMTMHGETLTYQEKAYMMPKDPGLLAEVNRWLKQIENSGQLAKTFASHLSH